MAIIDKELLENLASLSRIELDKNKEDKLINDFKNILAHFDELNSVDVSGIAPMNGGTMLQNIMREDEINRTEDSLAGNNQFPDSKDGLLRVPPIF